MSRYTNIDTGQKDYILKQIVQTERVKKEVEENIDSLFLRFNHDTNSDFVARTRLYNEIKNEKARLRYFETSLKRLNEKLKLYENNV